MKIYPLKYSYMSIPANIYFESDERTLRFRNQYGETFVFAPAVAVNTAFVFLSLFGCFIGFILGKAI